MFLSAMGMNPPGLASVAPAPTIAIADEDATFLMRSIVLATRFGSAGLRRARNA